MTNKPLHIEENGVGAEIDWYTLPGTSMDDYPAYVVNLFFDRPSLNPPGSDEGWIAEIIDHVYIDEFKPKMAVDIATKFYHYLMNFPRFLNGE